MQNKQGILIHNQKKILNELANYYENSYILIVNRVMKTTVMISLTELNLPTITDEECKECDKPIKSKECLTALAQLSHNKSPGLMVFQLDFIRYFGNILMISF